MTHDEKLTQICRDLCKMGDETFVEHRQFEKRFEAHADLGDDEGGYDEMN